MDLYEETSEIIKEFSEVFAIPIILEVIACISNSLSFVYSTNKLIYEIQGDSWENSTELFMRLPGYMLIAARLLLLVSLCGNITEEGMNVIKGIQKIQADQIAGYVPIRTKVLIRSQKPLPLSACLFIVFIIVCYSLLQLKS
jgi:hypothetical protein